MVCTTSLLQLRASAWIMSVSPSPERIEICTPPNSPKFGFPLPTSPTSAVPATPLKVPIGVHPRRGGKRRRLDSDSVEADTLHINDKDGTYGNSDVFGGYSKESTRESEQVSLPDPVHLHLSI